MNDHRLLYVPPKPSLRTMSYQYRDKRTLPAELANLNIQPAAIALGGGFLLIYETAGEATYAKLAYTDARIGLNAMACRDDEVMIVAYRQTGIASKGHGTGGVTCSDFAWAQGQVYSGIHFHRDHHSWNSSITPITKTAKVVL